MATRRPPTSHFLYQVLLALIATATPLPFKAAAVIILASACALTGVLLYHEQTKILIWDGRLKPDRLWGVAAAAFAATVILLMQPIVYWGDPQIYRIGYFWAEPYYSPTYELMKPLALFAAVQAAAFLVERSSGRPLVTATALSVVAGGFAKPNFIICLLPAVLGMAAVRAYQRQPFDRRALVLGIIVPAIAVLGFQYILTYGGLTNTEYQDSIIFAPLKVLSFHSDRLLVKLLLSIVFPVAVYALYWRGARRDTSLNFGFMLFVAGASLGYLFAEKVHWTAGNFLWSGDISLFILFVFSVLFYLRQALSTPWKGWTGARHIIAIIILFLHVRSGVLTEITFLHSKLGQYVR